MKIGILSENYKHDSMAMRSLLEKRYDKSIEFLPILKGIEGSDLDNLNKLGRLLRQTIGKKKLQYLILCRDLDALPSAKKKIQDKQDWQQKIQKEISIDLIFFLTIYELEALMLADIDTFNQIFQTKIKFKGNPLFKEDPKGFLQQRTVKSKRGRYRESDSPEIFQQLNFQTVYQNHAGTLSFQEFIDNLDKKFNQ